MMTLATIKSTAGVGIVLGLLALLAGDVHGERLYAVVGARISDEEVTVSKVKAVCLGKVTHWSSGKRAHPLVRDPSNRAGKLLFKTVLKMVPSRFRHHWTQRALSGKGVAPRQARSAVQAAKMAASRTGAIGFVLESELDEIAGISVRTIPLDR